MIKKFFLFLILFLTLVSKTQAVSDPRLSSNNKFGINLIVPEAEINNAATLVNTNGDWGYVVITVTKKERDLGRIQNILNSLNEKHLIPIIRLATNFDAKSGSWEIPGEHDADEWTNFLSQLYFPTQNRYIEVYNEVNHAQEWGGKADPVEYAKELSKTANALKTKSDDFFILNAPLDLSLPSSGNSWEASSYFQKMQESVPGIFDKIDGWSSHSYPNPAFSASPSALGRMGIDGYNWELSQIANYTNKDFPVFITETGWKRSPLTENQISEYYKQAFSNVWNDSRVVAVAPFVLSYAQAPFSQFSFSKDISSTAFYSYFNTIKDMGKTKGEPKRFNQIILESAQNSGLLERIGSYMDVKIKNSGNYILNPNTDLSIKLKDKNLIIEKTYWNKDKIYPGGDAEAVVAIKNISSKDTSTQIEISDKNQILSARNIIIYSPDLISLLSIQTKTKSASFGS